MFKEMKPLVDHHDENEHKSHWNRIQHPHRPAADLSKFWVITIISNPIRYSRRYELYWRFKEMCEAAGVKLITVEQAFGNRPFMVTRPDDPMNLQVRSVEELWHKENMINMGIKHALAICPDGVREVAWVDADCRPARMPKDWFEETWHQLQHYEFVQMWENLIDLDYNFNPMGDPQPSFMSNYIKYGTPNPEEFKAIQDGKLSSLAHRHRHHHHKHHHGRHHHHHHPIPDYAEGTIGKIFGRPGLAWAANLDALQKVNMLIDWCILGAGDWYMAHGLVGSINLTYNPEHANATYNRKLLEWQNKAERWIKRDVGFVSGVVYHDFHGKKINRGYGTRGKILTSNFFNPDTDIKYDGHGMLQLETWDARQIRLRDDIREYFRARNEDEIS